jgi:acetyl esterase/lipase
MLVTHVPATPDDVAAVSGEIQALHSRPHILGPADPTPVLPHTGGVPGRWITASPHLADTGVTLYAHGGGFARSNPRLEQFVAYRLSQATGRPVVTVDYSLAPAHPYPTALNEVVKVYRSLLDQGIPASKIVLAGESSGATLLLSALLLLKQAADPLPRAAVAVSPITDFTLAGRSIDTNDGKDILDRATLDHIRTGYLAGADPGQAPQSPLYGDLHGLPSLQLSVGAHELLLDDAHRFAQAASAAGVDVRLDVYDAMPHAFHATSLPVADTLLHRTKEWIGRLLVTSP